MITPSSSTSLNNRYFGLPFWDFGVTVPTSINPKPKFDNSLKSFASLSKPAAKPIGFEKSKPKKCCFNIGWSVCVIVLIFNLSNYKF